MQGRKPSTQASFPQGDASPPAFLWTRCSCSPPFASLPLYDKDKPPSRGAIMSPPQAGNREVRAVELGKHTPCLGYGHGPKIWCRQNRNQEGPEI